MSRTAISLRFEGLQNWQVGEGITGASAFADTVEAEGDTGAGVAVELARMELTVVA